LGTVARLRGQYLEAAGFFAGALRLRQALGDRPRIAAALNNLGTALVNLKDPKAEQTLLEGVKLCEAIGDVVNMARCLNNLGVLYNDVLKRHDDARAAYLRVLKLQSEIGDVWGIALSTHNLGVTAYHQQEYQEAKTHYLETLQIATEFPQLQHEALYNLAEVELALSEHTAAQTHITELMRLLEQIPSHSSDYDAAFYSDAKALQQKIEGGQ
jgi:tetratricopeptide (TPR) repeat protein